MNERRFGPNICVANMATYHGKYSEDMKEVRDAMSKSYSWLTGMSLYFNYLSLTNHRLYAVTKIIVSIEKIALPTSL